MHSVAISQYVPCKQTGKGYACAHYYTTGQDHSSLMPSNAYLLSDDPYHLTQDGRTNKNGQTIAVTPGLSIIFSLVLLKCQYKSNFVQTHTKFILSTHAFLLMIDKGLPAFTALSVMFYLYLIVLKI